MGMENNIFWSETRSGFEKPGGKLPIILLRIAPPPPSVDVVITDLHLISLDLSGNFLNSIQFSFTSILKKEDSQTKNG